MSLNIPEDILHSAGMTESDLAREVAVMLFQQNKISLGQASHLAGMGQLQFQHLLSSRNIPVHYDVADFEADLKTLGDLGRL